MLVPGEQLADSLHLICCARPGDEEALLDDQELGSLDVTRMQSVLVGIMHKQSKASATLESHLSITGAAQHFTRVQL